MQDEDADERGENRGEILDRDRGREMHVLHGDEEGEEGERAESAARDEQGVIVPFPIESPACDLDSADHPRDEATEENDFHRRDAIELLHEDVHGREGECREEHVAHGAARPERAGAGGGLRHRSNVGEKQELRRKN